MTTQQIIAVGPMEPNGHEEAIGRVVEYIQEHQPDRVIATAGAAEDFLQSVRAVYDGWIGVHLSSARLCDEYGAEALPDLFEFASGWATYSGETDPGRVPTIAVLIAAKRLNMSLVSGNPPVIQLNRWTIVDDSGNRLRSNTGIGIGHLRDMGKSREGDLGFAHLLSCGSWLEGKRVSIRKGGLSFSELDSIESIPTDIDVDLGEVLRRYIGEKARASSIGSPPVTRPGASGRRLLKQSAADR